MNIFERTREKREQDAGLKDKQSKKEDKPVHKKEMTNEEFFYGTEKRPPQSKKWIEK